MTLCPSAGSLEGMPPGEQQGSFQLPFQHDPTMPNKQIQTTTKPKATLEPKGEVLVPFFVRRPLRTRTAKDLRPTVHRGCGKPTWDIYVYICVRMEFCLVWIHPALVPQIILTIGVPLSVLCIYMCCLIIYRFLFFFFRQPCDFDLLGQSGLNLLAIPPNHFHGSFSESEKPEAW